MNLYGTEFWKFSSKGSFFQKNAKKIFFNVVRLQAAIYKSAMITDRRKFVTKWSLYGMSIFYFYCWNQFKVIPLVCTLRTRNLPQIFCEAGRRLTARQITLSSVSRRQLVTIDYWVTWHKAASNAGSKQLVLRQRNDSSRILYCGHSTQCSS